MKAVGASKGAQGRYQQTGQGKALTPTTKELTFHTDLLDPRGIHKFNTPWANQSLHPTLPAPDVTAFRDQKPGHSPLNLGDIHLRNHKMNAPSTTCLPPDNPFLDGRGCQEDICGA